MDSFLDLFTFYTMERTLFHHLVQKMAVDPLVAKHSIALWLWLEFIGHHDIVQHILASPEEMLPFLVAESEACLAVLRRDSPQPTETDDIPVTSGLIKEPINLRFFHYNRDVVAHGMSHFLEKVCNVIFDVEAKEKHGPPAKGSRGGGGEGTSRAAPAGSVPGSGLNPAAEPWSPDLARSSEDHRSMFLTFSRGYPLKKEEVHRFFSSRWGNCVQFLSIERTQSGTHPMYGRIVFNNASVIPLILNGNSTAKFVVNGKHLWARLFVPKSH